MLRRKRLTLLLLLPLLHGCLVLAGCSNCTPLLIDPLTANPEPVVVDAEVELARTYAPWIYHAVHPIKGRQDLPTRVDFDGDLRGDNNWDHFPRYELPPTVYYAVVESETHWFISYHLFHPRDWSYVRIGMHETHENDGENLQVVVRKESGRVELLYTQAHYYGKVYAEPGSGVSGGDESIRARLLLVNDRGRPDPQGTHAAVFVQSHGHGIYGALDPCAKVEVSTSGRPLFERGGLVLRPAGVGDVVREPDLSSVSRSPAALPYQLESTTAKLWPLVEKGTLVGRDGLLDGAVALESPTKPIVVDVPRYYEADRFSGPFGPDRGISPFALDFGFCEGKVGALFFDPANRYAQCLVLPEPWSREYVAYPF